MLVPASLAASAYARTSLTGQTQLNLATGTIEGLLTGTMDGESASVFSSTTILGQKQRGSVMFLTTSHVFTIVGGSHDGKQLRTVDNAHLVPLPTPDVFRIDFRSGVTATSAPRVPPSAHARHASAAARPRVAVAAVASPRRAPRRRSS